jgi:hypothetical protein
MKEISLEEALEIIYNHDSELAEESAEQLEDFYEMADRIVLYDSEHELPELRIGDDIVLVDGDLKVSGLVMDADHVDQSMLIVLGDMYCENLITLSGMYITGNLEVQHAILGDSLCDYMLMVGEDIRCETLLDYGHAVVSRGDIHATDIFSFHSIEDLSGNVAANLERKDLIPEVVRIDNGELLEDRSKTIQYIRGGGKVFRKN